MNKLEIGTKLYKLLRTADNDTLRNELIDMVSEILVEEFPTEATPAKIVICEDCKLYETRTRIVPGRGNVNSEIMFVGEAPGFQEDLEGSPFVGPAGKMLDRILHAAQRTLKNPRWKRENIYITNLVKCRPPGNRTPEEDEIEACKQYLAAEIEKVNPKVIVCWGVQAANALIHPRFNMSEEIGIFFTDSEGRKMIGLYHPSYILRAEEANSSRIKVIKNAVFDGIKKIDAYLDN